MGAVLCAPVRSQLLSRVGDKRFRVGAAQMQGFRTEMEDAHCICLNLEGHPNVSFFGVYDGHSGDKVSKHLAKHLHNHISHVGPGLEDQALQQAVVEFDLEVGKFSNMRDNGSTCIFALVQPHNEDSGQEESSKEKLWKVTVANVGDSRAMLIRADGKLVSLTTDHKPSVRSEAKRIQTAGGFVQNDRVDGDLAMSRAIGDFKYKKNADLGPLAQKVIALPTISHDVVYPGDRLLVVCDGIVERIDNKEVAKFVHATHKRHEKDPAEVMRLLNLYSLARGSTDNHSAMLVCFDNGVSYDGPDVFMPGPFSAWKEDRSFKTAYIKNAQAWGQSSDNLPSLIAEGDASNPEDWRKVSRVSTNWMAWLPAALLLTLLAMVLYNMDHPSSLWGSNYSDEE